MVNEWKKLSGKFPEKKFQCTEILFFSLKKNNDNDDDDGIFIYHTHTHTH